MVIIHGTKILVLEVCKLSLLNFSALCKGGFGVGFNYGFKGHNGMNQGGTEGVYLLETVHLITHLDLHLTSIK